MGELETSVKELTFELQEQQQKCKELDEMLVIREAEVFTGIFLGKNFESIYPAVAIIF